MFIAYLNTTKTNEKKIFQNGLQDQTSYSLGDHAETAKTLHFWQGLEWKRLKLEIDRYIGRSRCIGRYLGFTDILVSTKTADCVGLSRCWRNVVIFLTHADNLRKKAQRTKSRQLSYSNASRCVFINKQTRQTMEHMSAVANRNKSIIINQIN